MKTFRGSLICLLMLHLTFPEGHRGYCLDNVWQLSKPSVSSLQAVSEKQTILVSWMVNHSMLVGDFYEIQIGRTENHTLIHNTNVSLLSVDSDEYTWTWTSSLPLECVDHSIRIRCFYNQSVPSPWSDWITSYGAQAQDKTKMFPFQRVLREGTSAMFCCVPPPGVKISSITLNNSKHPMIDIGATVKAITVDNLTIPKTVIEALTLTCKDDTDGMSWSVWNYVSFPPQKPRNIRCVTSDMRTITCSWDSGRKRSPYDRNKQTQTLHIENEPGTIECNQSSCTFQAVPHLEEYKISIVVRNQLGEETASNSFNITDRVSPVVEWYRVSPGVTNTTMSWIIQGNLTQQNLLCQITTDPGNVSELSCDNVSEICKVNLEHLLPNTHYSTRVRCSVNGRLWGEWTQPQPFTTYPLVTLDVWRTIKQLFDPNSRQVKLLWTPRVSGSAATVNIQRYIIKWSQGDKNWTEWKDGGETQADVFIGSGRCDFTLTPVVRSGSTVSAHITIPQRDDGEMFPVEKRLHSGKDAGFYLSWDSWDAATCGYIVEWCILRITDSCALKWMKVPKGTNTLSLPAENFKAGCRHTFHIYGCTSNGHRLLEIQIGYSQELRSVQPPTLVEATSAYSSVTLEWHYNEDDGAHPAFITGYLVMGQEVNPLPGHANVFNVSVADPRRKSVTVDGLQQDQEYVFTVSALTTAGPGRPASITVQTRTSYFIQVAKILTPTLLLLCCIVLLSGLKGKFAYPAGMNIKIRDLDSFLHENMQRLQAQEAEECSGCDIEIVNIGPPPDNTAALSDPETPDSLHSRRSPPSTLSLSRVLLKVDYCPQVVAELREGRGLQQMSLVINDAYFCNTEEDLCGGAKGEFEERSESGEVT